MAVKVIRAFRFTDTGRVYLRGESFEGGPDVIAKLAAEGFLEGGVGAAEAASAPAVGDLRPDYASMTVKQLEAELAARGIALRGRRRKADMAAMLEEADGGTR